MIHNAFCRYFCFSMVWAVATANIGVASERAHPVSVIEADILVSKFKTTMRLKCFAEDLELLQGVEALEDGFYDTDELREATVDHASFLAERIQLIGSDGNAYAAQIVNIDDFEVPEGRVRQGELMQYTIGVVLEYKYDKAPEFLTIQQSIVAEDLLLPSELRILLKQAGSADPFFKMMKPDQPETYRFDWSKPVPDSDDQQQWLSWIEEQREKTLGISSYSSVYSFIYITNYQIRHEVLIPLATLSSFFEIERADPAFLEIAEQDIAAEKIKQLFSIGNPVEIDQIPVAPVFDRIDFYGLDLTDFAVIAARRKVSMANGRVGVIMSYSTKGIPSDVKVTWDKFNDVLKTVDAAVIAFDDVKKAEFSMFADEGDNTYHWQSSDRPPAVPIRVVLSDPNGHFKKPKIKLPVVSTILAVLTLPILIAMPLIRKTTVCLAASGVLIIGSVLCAQMAIIEFDDPLNKAPEVNSEQAERIFTQLHRNMFRAFDYHSESEIYDALAHSVSGDLLQKLYLEINDSLRMEEQGGAVSRVDSVNMVAGGQLEKPPTESDNIGFGYRSQWELLGTVEHWGHIHQRQIRCDAEFTVELIDKTWKITDMNVKDFARGKITRRLRKL